MVVNHTGNVQLSLIHSSYTCSADINKQHCPLCQDAVAAQDIKSRVA